jgi:ATP/maltotriose-dependent transcriptional regulator MalT
MLSFYSGDQDEAARVATEAIRGGLPVDSPSPSLPYIVLGNIEAARGNMEDARRVVAEGREALQANGADPWHVAVLASCESIWDTMAGDFERARAVIAPVIPEVRRSRNPSALATALFAYGWASLETNPDAALAALEESASLTRNRAGEAAFGPCLMEAARLLARRGDLRGAFERLAEAAEHCHAIADYPELAGVLRTSGTILIEAGWADAGAVINGFVDDGAVTSFAVTFGGPEREEHDAAQARARAELGERYEAASTRGAAMTYEEIVEHTLRAIDHATSELGDA